IYPILDAALLIEKQRHTLDWDRILAIVRESWASTALHLMLTYLRRWDLALVPPEVLNTLAASDRHANRIFFRLLHRLVTMYAIEGRPFGLAATTEGHLRVVWSNLLRPMSPTANLFSVPYHLAFPPGHPERFNPSYALRQVGGFARRAVLKVCEPAGGAWPGRHATNPPQPTAGSCLTSTRTSMTASAEPNLRARDRLGQSINPVDPTTCVGRQ